MALEEGNNVVGGRSQDQTGPERDEKANKDPPARDGISSASSDGSDSEGEDGPGEEKRARELEDDEAEALKRDLGEDVRVGKRVRRADPGAREAEDHVGQEKPSAQSEQVWETLKAGSTVSVGGEPSIEEDATVLVKRTYRFAGEEVTEEKVLPASHPDAIAFLARTRAAPLAGPVGKTPLVPTSNARPAPGPRKKKSSLAAMSAAATGKPAKINTLEKSKMDWNKFKEQTVGERERDEMEAQTKGGGSGLGSMKGYMERQGFLDRVQGRLEEQKKQ